MFCLKFLVNQTQNPPFPPKILSATILTFMVTSLISILKLSHVGCLSHYAWQSCQSHHIWFKGNLDPAVTLAQQGKTCSFAKKINNQVFDYHRQCNVFKACVCYVLSNFYFFTKKNYEKCSLFHPKSSFRSQDNQIFAIFSLPFQTFQIQKDKWKWNNLCHELTHIHLQI